MNPLERLDPQLLEMLSAYLDGRLEGAEKAALEERLNKEDALRRQLAELRSVRDLLRELPLLKPPRSFALTPALAGKTSGKVGVFFPRRMALGSALASLAFVCVLSVDVLSRGLFLGAATVPPVLSANEAFSSPRQSMDSSGAGKSVATMGAPGPTATGTLSPVATRGIGTGCDICIPTRTPTGTPSPSIMLGSGCGDCDQTEEYAANPPQVVTVPPATMPQPRLLPDFQAVAQYLEAFLGLAAVLLAATAALAAIIIRRRR